LCPSLHIRIAGLAVATRVMNLKNPEKKIDLLFPVVITAMRNAKLPEPSEARH
jgi:hypothetical protein